MKKSEFNKFVSVAYTCDVPAGQRRGQSLMHSLCYLFQPIYEHISGKKFDPFYDDEKIPAFLEEILNFADRCGGWEEEEVPTEASEPDIAQLATPPNLFNVDFTPPADSLLGLSKLDLFAAIAMHGIVSRDSGYPSRIAASSYTIAAAMLVQSDILASELASETDNHVVDDSENP